ncbi:MAG: chemotaxis protein CheD, partial [Deltaproteobacteria bacterium]|nr:chemotaxis protein CheD [Deltaproteobacteria bacterium]
KVFGGSVFYGGSAEASIGAKNAEAALALLEGTGIRVAAADVGGSLGRKIFFDTRTGAVRLKPLGAATQSPGAPHGLEYRTF